MRTLAYTVGLFIPTCSSQKYRYPAYRFTLELWRYTAEAETIQMQAATLDFGSPRQKNLRGETEGDLPKNAYIHVGAASRRPCSPDSPCGAFSSAYVVQCAVEPLPRPRSAALLYGGTTLLPAASFPELVYLVGGCPKSILRTAVGCQPRFL